MRKSEHQVVIAGGGPTGLMLAEALATWFGPPIEPS